MTRSLWLLLLLGGCAGSGPKADDSAPLTVETDADADADGDADADTDADTDPTGTTTSDTGTTTSTTTAAAAMCARWNADRVDMSEGVWSGSVGTCDPGTLDATGIANTLKLVNLYRWLAGMPAVTDDPAKNALSQECGLMMDANNDLDHYPPATWTCYTADGASGAASSNIATTASVAAIDLYMVDYGNSGTLGHRRWILSDWLGTIGIGGTMDYSCLHVIGGFGGAGNADWIAFPSPGAFPLEAMTLSSWASVDEEGWHVQSDSIDLSSASVTVSKNGTDLPVVLDVLPANYGSSYALNFKPNGWTTSPGTYQVSFTGVSQPIAYDVEIVDCSLYP